MSSKFVNGLTNFGNSKPMTLFKYQIKMLTVEETAVVTSIHPLIQQTNFLSTIITFIMNRTYYTSSTNLLPPKTNHLYIQIKYVFNNYCVLIML